MNNESRTFRRVWVGLWVALAMGAAASSASPAWAGPLPGSALESPVGRFLLGETAQGLELMTRVLGRGVAASDIDEFLVRMRGASPEDLTQLEARVARIREDLHRAQVQRNGGRDVAESDAFSGDERAILREVAARELRVDERWRTADPHPGEIDFTGNDGAAGSSRAEFLAPAEEGAMRDEGKPGEQAPEAVEQRAKRGLKQWYDDAQSCLQNRPEEAAKAAEWRYLAQQLAISAGNTTIGYFAHTGISHFELGGFGVDLLMSLVSTGVSQSWMSSRDTFQVRWLKVYSWGHLRTDLDAEVYRINPWTDTHGLPMDQAAAERKSFNYWWNDRTSWVNPLLFTVINGVECLMEEGNGASGAARAARFRKGAFVSRMGISVGTSILYYKVRGSHVPSSSGH